VAKAKKRSKRPRAEPAGTLRYKVVELSTVDEATLERTLNEAVGNGWTLDGVQFAMRESSKRPAMAFVLFTRADGRVKDSPRPAKEPVYVPSLAGARQRLIELAGGLDHDEES
jgi:hypothetical protein